MEASELRNFSVDELRGRISQWKEELFRVRFKSESSEAKDTSVFVKLRKDIARAKTVLNEKDRGVALPAKPIQVDAAPKAKKASKQEAKAVEAPSDAEPQDKPAKKKPSEKVKTDGK